MPNFSNMHWKIVLQAHTAIVWCRPVLLDRTAIASPWYAAGDYTDRPVGIVCFVANWRDENQSVERDFDRPFPNMPHYTQTENKKMKWFWKLLFARRIPYASLWFCSKIAFVSSRTWRTTSSYAVINETNESNWKIKWNRSNEHWMLWYSLDCDQVLLSTRMPFPQTLFRFSKTVFYLFLLSAQNSNRFPQNKWASCAKQYVNIEKNWQYMFERAFCLVNLRAQLGINLSIHTVFGYMFSLHFYSWLCIFQLCVWTRWTKITEKCQKYR